MPNSRIESAKSCRAFSSKWRRGWSGSGLICETGSSISLLTWWSSTEVGSKDSSKRSVGIRASKPRPRPFLDLLLAADTVNYLLCEIFVGAGAFAEAVVSTDRDTVRRSFGESDIARDIGTENFCVEVFTNFVHDLVAEGSTRIDHRRKDAEEFEARVHSFFD